MNNEELPIGLTFALAANLQAMQRFMSFTPQQKQQVIQHTHSVNSRDEMREFVNNIAEGYFF